MERCLRPCKTGDFRRKRTFKQNLVFKVTPFRVVVKTPGSDTPTLKGALTATMQKMKCCEWKKYSFQDHV